VAFLDSEGVIIGVNEAWNAFCTENGGNPNRCGVGTSYLALCDAAGDEASLQLGAIIRATLAGDLHAPTTVLVPCSAPDGPPRWFDVAVAPMRGSSGGVVGASVILWQSSPSPASTALRVEHVVAIGRRADCPGVDAWEVLDATSGAIVLVDDDAYGTIVFVNRAFERLSGYDRSDLLGRGLETLMAEHESTRHAVLREGYRAQPFSGPMGQGRQSLRTARGAFVDVAVVLAPVYTDGRATFVASLQASEPS